VGKTAADPIVAGKDISIVSGASISSKSVALGVKRDTLVLQAALKNGL
jgi:Na+-translocating ferredoxin:NAD+ oxidoreductase subunit G